MNKKSPLSAIILASEITKGMKSIGSKALLPISGSVTLIDYQIQFLKRFYNPVEIYICTGFDHEKIVKKTQKYKDIKYAYNKEYTTHNQMHSLLLCIEKYKLNHCLIINNGVLISQKIQIDNKHTQIFTMNPSKKTEFGIGCNINNDSTTYLFYDLPYKWTECAFISETAIRFLLKYSKGKDLSKLFLFEGLNLIADNINHLKTKKIDKISAIKINTIKDLSRAKKYYEKHICAKHI